MQLTRIRRYPVKSCRGEDVGEALVEPWGLAGDRRWMLVDPDGHAVTARECHPLLLVVPEITAYGLRLEAPGLPPLEVKEPGPATTRVTVWSSEVPVATAGGEADRWFSRAAGRDVRLVHLADPTARPTDPAYGEAGDRVSLADGFPLHLVNEESLAALNDEVLDRSEGGLDPLPLERFRPNVVVSGAPAWAEDDWRRIRIGPAAFRAVKACERCVLTTLDPETGEGGKEPIRSLARIRRWDGKTWFGVDLVPDDPGTTITVGDEVTVLDGVPPGGGPLRAATVG